MSTATDYQPHLFKVSPPSSIFVNERCMIYDDEEMRVVMLNGLPVFRYHRDDWSAEATFIAQAQEAGFAQGTELAAALGKSVRTAYRIRRRFLTAGAGGLVPKKPGPKGARLGAAREAAIRRWRLEGRTTNWIAQRLKISPHTVKSALIRMGLTTEPESVRQGELLPSVGEAGAAAAGDAVTGAGTETAGDVQLEEEAGRSAQADVAVGVEVNAGANLGAATTEAAEAAAAEPGGVAAGTPDWQAGSTLDADPGNRAGDRVLAAIGLLDDAAPLFAAATAVPRAGVLLTLPALVNSGVFEVAHEVYGNIGPAFYGLRTMLLTMVLFALLRIRHPENVKEYSSADLGRIIGLDRAPEVKTIRRKLACLTADEEQSEYFIDALVRRRIESVEAALGFLYVDGHVRVYHGQADLPKAHVARMRLSLPATQDVWVNDANGDPVFLVTQKAHGQLVSALPPILEQVRGLVGERRVTVVFDRGGWSPQLFQRMHAEGFDVLTYRKGKDAPLPADAFTSYTVELPTGRVTYELHDTTVAVGTDAFRMRQVTRRNGDHQTQIVTTRHDLPVTEVARRMFERWRQENFFKYMRQEYALDALIEYGTEPDDAARLVANPARKVVDDQLKSARQELKRLEEALVVATFADRPQGTPDVGGLEALYGAGLRQRMWEVDAHIDELVSQRDALPARVAVSTLKDEVVRLRMRRKRFSDVLKMLAYQVETDVVRAIAPSYARHQEDGRRLIRAAFQSAADIESTDTELRVTLAAQSSAHRSLALAQLCAQLNDTQTYFPGTALLLRYAVRGAEPAT